MRSNKTSDILLELLAVAFLATAGIFIRKSTFAPINLGLWRMILAVPFLFLLAFKDLKGLTKKDILLALLSGVFLSGDLIFFNLSIVNTSLANTNLLTNLTSMIIVPVSYFVFKEKMPKLYLLGLAVAVLGVIILVTGKSTASASHYSGDFLAMGACVFYSLFFLTTYKLRERISSSVIMFIGAFGTICSLLIAVNILEGGVQVPKTMNEFLYLLAFAIVMQVIGQNLLAYCHGKISINLSSAITLTQPVIAGIYSMIFFNEFLTTKEIIGMVIVIIGVYACKYQYQKKGQK